MDKKELTWKLSVGDVVKDENRDITIIDKEIRKTKKKDKSCKSGYANIQLKYYKYRCNKCSNEDWIKESNLFYLKRGCNACSGKKVTINNCMATKRPDLLKYLLNKEDGYNYTCGNSNKIKVKCPICGFEKEIQVSKLVNRGFLCNICGDKIAYSNKFMGNLLMELNIGFISEYMPNWSRYKRYDFYFECNNNRYIVEMDGLWHKKDNTMSGKTAKESILDDNIKDELAKEHGIEVIRIDCGYANERERFNYIKNSILNSKLGEIFNFDSINWKIINFKCQTNKVKEICNYWSLHNDINKEELTTKDLSNIFNINRNIINGYLAIGNECGICNYNGKEELIKTNKKRKGKTRTIKPVKIYKNKVMIGFYKNSTELSKISEEKYGVLLRNNGIGSVARGEVAQYKGFTFEYSTVKEYEDYICKKSTYSPKN